MRSSEPEDEAKRTAANELLLCDLGKVASALHAVGDVFMKMSMAADAASQALTGMALMAESYAPNEERGDGK